MTPSADTRRALFCCVIPVYNNAGTVFDVIERCRKQTPHVLVVNDGSTDTAELESFCMARAVIYRSHTRNKGKGAAIRTAVEALSELSPDYMVTLDADGQHYPEDLTCFEQAMQKNDWTMLIGARDFSEAHIPQGSRFGRKFSNFWFSLETGLTLTDTQSGFRAYPYHFLRQLTCRAGHYAYETEILARAAWAGLEFQEIPIQTWYPKEGRRITHFRPVSDNVRISLVHARLILARLFPFGQKPLRKRKFPFSLLRPKEFLLYLLHEEKTPSALAAAAFAGTFLAVLPLFGFHSVAILYASAKLHLNKLMAFNIQHLFMPPVTPVLCIELGYWMRHGEFLTEISFQTAVGELRARIWEWLLGSLVLAPLFACVTGSLVYLIAGILWKTIKKK